MKNPIQLDFQSDVCRSIIGTFFEYKKYSLMISMNKQLF